MSTHPLSGPATLRIAVFGASGSAGSGALRACLADPRVREVVVFVRRTLGVTDPKLREVVCHDFKDLAPVAAHLEGVDACLYCLGVSQSQVPDEAAYREITLDYALAAARTLLARSPACVFHFLSGSGTDPRSRFMWARVKAETELALQQLGLRGCVCWRPGYIHPPTPPARRFLAERLGRALYPLIRGFSGLSIPADDLGRAMLQATLEGRLDGVLENREIRECAARHAAGPA